MKKILFFLALFLGGVKGIQANPITFLNLTGCDFSFSLRGLETPPNTNYVFQSAQIIIPPGTTNFTSPSAVPGLGGLPATATFYYVKGYSVSSPACNGSVGSVTWGGLPQIYISSTDNCFPACNNYSSFTVQWSENPNGDVTVLIF